MITYSDRFAEHIPEKVDVTCHTQLCVVEKLKHIFEQEALLWTSIVC